MVLNAKIDRTAQKQESPDVPAFGEFVREVSLGRFQGLVKKELLA